MRSESLVCLIPRVGTIGREESLNERFGDFAFTTILGDIPRVNPVMRLFAPVLVLLFLFSSWSVSDDAVSLTDRKRILDVRRSVQAAGRSYAANKYDRAADEIRSAIELVGQIAKQSPELMPQLSSQVTRIEKAKELLQARGITLPPVLSPAPMTVDSKPSPTKPSLPKVPQNDALSFKTVVAPILANRCGQCHVSGAKGGFRMTSYATLMKGPPEGVVIFPGDIVGSRLIETIETGDMPRGSGEVTAEEFATLKAWVAAGAKFDGDSPGEPLLGSGGDTASAQTEMKVARSTGSETVSFAKDVAGLLVKNCSGCHIDSMQVRGGLRMDNFASLLRGGDSGAIVQPGDGSGSLLIRKMRGMEGDRMPSGGRPPLAEEDIQLIATWIDEGAKLDGANETQPLVVMNQLAWALSASPDEVAAKRAELASQAWTLVNGSDKSIDETQSVNFLVTGIASKATLDLVSSVVEKQMKVVESVVPSSDDVSFDGRATVFVFPKRYGYSEFAKMVEGRSVPTGWTNHWSFDGINAYIAVVASERDDAKEIESRLLAPTVSLSVATSGIDVPRWFAEGIGVATSMRKAKLSRDERRKIESETLQAVSATPSAESFLAGKLTPEQSDRVGAALATTFLDRSYRRKFDQLLRQLGQGSPFDDSFEMVFGVTTTTFVDAWLGQMRR